MFSNFWVLGRKTVLRSQCSSCSDGNSAKAETHNDGHTWENKLNLFSSQRLVRWKIGYFATAKRKKLSHDCPLSAEGFKPMDDCFNWMGLLLNFKPLQQWHILQGRGREFKDSHESWTLKNRGHGSKWHTDDTYEGGACCLGATGKWMGPLITSQEIQQFILNTLESALLETCCSFWCRGNDVDQYKNRDWCWTSSPWSVSCVFTCLLCTRIPVKHHVCVYSYLQAGQMNVFDYTLVSGQHRLL